MIHAPLRRCTCAAAIVTLVALRPLVAAAAAPSAARLADLTLEQLSNIQVTAVSRQAEPLSSAAGSVYVITRDAIRRSGAVTLPEALRLAPNLQVARADANQYAISARGFASTLANKMLVMIDGRTVYSPLFSGVFWEVQDLMLEDVERIEVMSGSGGTAWGSNAVNGFINVITRAAADTQGALATIGAGTQGRLAAARYGGAWEGGGHYRLYARGSTRRQSSNVAGTGLNDAARDTRAGFRSDWADGTQAATLQGDIYDTDIDQGAVLAPRRLSGFNLLGRITRTLEAGASWRLQAYVDRTERDQPGSVRDRLDTLDLEWQYELPQWGAHNWLVGAGYRHQSDDLVNLGPALAFLPPDRNTRLANLLVQDQIALQDTLSLTLALKLEHNAYTGTEALPNARLAWKLSPTTLVWGAVSRTVRIPARVDRELFSPATPPFVALAGGPDFDSEVAKVFELGYRGQPLPGLSYSVTAFHHRFDRLRSVSPTPAGPQLQNNIVGSSTGMEGWAAYQASETLRLNAGFTRLNEKLRTRAGSVALGGTATLGNDPELTWTLGLSWDVTPDVDLDVNLRHVGALPNPAVPAYSVIDVRLGWRLRRDLELALVARNLGSPHAEWGVAPGRPEFGRAWLVQLNWGL